MSEMVSSGSKYTDQIRQQAAVLYAVNGTAASVSRELDIPEPTLCEWRKQEWWQQLVEEVRTQNQDQHIALYHELTRKALQAADRGLEDLAGQELKAADIKALVVTGATATDKARLLLNQPTSIKGDSSTVQALADQFKSLSKQWDEKQVNVVSVQVGDDEQPTT